MDKKIKKILGPPEGFKLTKEWIQDYQGKMSTRKRQHKVQWRSLEHKKGNKIASDFWEKINNIVTSIFLTVSGLPTRLTT